MKLQSDEIQVHARELTHLRDALDHEYTLRVSMAKLVAAINATLSDTHVLNVVREEPRDQKKGQETVYPEEQLKRIKEEVVKSKEAHKAIGDTVDKVTKGVCT